MKKIINSFVIAGSIAALGIVSTPSAQAHDIYVKHYHHNHVQKNSGNNAVAWGIIGLAAGAIIAGAASNNTTVHRRVVTPPKHYPGANHFPPAPGNYTYRQKRHYSSHTSNRSYEPWTKGWYAYCDRKYRSFNPRTGTFRGYDGRDHFCVAR